MGRNDMSRAVTRHFNRTEARATAVDMQLELELPSLPSATQPHLAVVQTASQKRQGKSVWAQHSFYICVCMWQ